MRNVTASRYAYDTAMSLRFDTPCETCLAMGWIHHAKGIRSMLKKIVLITAVLMLSACMTYQGGTKVDHSKLSQLKPGVTTVAQTEKLLGKPEGSIRNSDGSLILSYSFSSFSRDAKSYIPVVGSFIGKTHQKSDGTMIYFDRKGHFTKWTSMGASN